MAEVTKNVNPAELARKAAALRQLCQHRHRPLLVPDPRFGVTRARLSVDDPHPATPRRRTLTDVQHVQLGGTPQRATPRVPDPQFPKKIPAGRRSRHPVPPLLAASRTPTSRSRNSRVDSHGGRAAPRKGACICCNPPRSSLPPPRATPPQYASAGYLPRASLSPAARPGHCAWPVSSAQSPRCPAPTPGPPHEAPWAQSPVVSLIRSVL